MSANFTDNSWQLGDLHVQNTNTKVYLYSAIFKINFQMRFTKIIKL